VALEKEIDFVLHHINRYLTKDPMRNDILSQFAGLRPLVKGNTKNTAVLSRDHHISISDSELISITGGKWTTYRRMAEDVLEIAAHKAGLPERECRTRQLPIHGFKEIADYNTPLYYYGTDAENIISLVKADKSLAEPIHPRLSFIKAEIIWAVQQEMCMTIEDALSRRTRALLLDAKAAIEAAPVVGAIMANEMKKEAGWIKIQLDAFYSIAKNYLPI